MSDVALQREQQKQEVEQLARRVEREVSQSEALALACQLSVSRALLLLSEQLSPSATA